MFTRHLIREYGGKDTRNQYNAYKGSLSFIQRLQIERRLEVHSGCVNTICWNDRGTNILSGSDDLHLVVSNPYNGKIIHKIRSGHRQNIFSAKYLANGLDNETISCSGDGKIFYTHLEREDLANAHMFDCHFGTTYEVLVIPNEASTFLSCGEDGTVRFFDLREKSSCSKPSCKEDVMITCRSAITAMAANPLHPWQLGVGCSDSSVRIYDRRMLGTRATGNYSGKSLKGLLSMFTPPSLEKESYRVTSLHYSSDGRDVLVSYSSEQIYIFSSQDCDDFKPLVKEVPEIKSSGVPATESSDEPSPGQSSASDGVALPTNDTETRQPPVKRLRLRGDWSDTGPGARPERQTPGGTTSEAGQEHQEATGSARSRVMNRMSDLLTRWLVTNMRSTQAQRDSQTTEGGGEQGAQELVGADRGATEGSLEGASEGDQPASDNNHEPVQEIHEFSEETQAMLTEMGRDIPRNVSSQSDSLSGQHSGEAEMYSESENVQSEKESTACGHTDDSSFNDSQTVPSKSDIANVEESLTNIDNGTSSKSIPEICRDHDINESKSKGYDEDAYTPQTFNLKAESPDSVGSKSDESQSSVVNKIEVMAVSDELAEDNSSKHCDNETEISDAYNPLYPTTYKSALESEIAGGMESNSVPVSQPEAGELGSHGEQDRSESSLANNTSERTEIRAAVESLRAQNLAPVVSLHYSSEGTSAGTIRVGFTQFQSLEDEIAAENPTLGDSQTESDNNSVSVIRQNISDTVNTSSSQQELNVDDSRDIANSSVLQGNSEVNDGSKNQKHTPENDNRHASESYSMETQNTKSEETMLKPFCPEEMEVASGSNVKDLPDDVDSDMEENEQAYCDNEDRTRTKLLPSVSVQVEGAMSNEGKSEQNIVDNKVDINIIAEDSESHTEEIRSEVLETVTSVGNEATGDSRTDSQATGGEENVSGTLPRQRRIGHSGPPTGSFHLNSSDSSSDDEGGAESRREDLMRQTAARKLQAFHRLRQEAREKKEMAESNIGRPTVKHVYKGHRNARTMIKEASFWGDNYVMSGSDCGHVFVWDRHTTEVVMLLEADKHVVNCIQPHPFDPVLATSGIDYDIKIWSPLNEKPSFDEQRAKEVMLHNEIMLEETRDTITVPASFMLRVLASINSIRSGRRAMERNRTSSGENQDEAGRQASDTD